MPDVLVINPDALPLSPGVNDTDSFVQLIGTKLYRCPATLAKAYFEGAGGGGGDVTAPTVTSRTTPNAGPSTIVVVFSESVTVTTAGWSAKKNGSAWSISSVSGSGNTWTFTMGSAAVNGDTLQLSYDSGTGATVDGSANELASFTDASVTNNVAGTYDSDAEAFFTYSGITNTTIKDAINAHVVELKSLGLWATKITRIYPFVGGTSATHKCDLRNPSAPNDLTYRGTQTHTANGMECAIGDNLALTPTIPAVSMDIANLSFGVYISQDEQVSSLAKLTAGVVGANSYALSIVARYTNDQSYYGMTDSGGNVSPANTVAPGFYSLSRTANNVGKAFKNGAQAGSTFTSVQTTLPTTYQMGINGGTADGAGNYNSGENQVRYYYEGLGLTDTEMLDFYNSIQDLQTALSRAV